MIAPSRMSTRLSARPRPGRRALAAVGSPWMARIVAPGTDAGTGDIAGYHPASGKREEDDVDELASARRVQDLTTAAVLPDPRAERRRRQAGPGRDQHALGSTSAPWVTLDP